jgi:zinc protease
LRIGAGSLNEGEDQQGLAHMLEHLAFKGSTHVPAGDVFQILQRKGLELGPDTNATTELDQTTYKFNLPQSDEDSLDTGLNLLREIAGELTLSPAAMDAERGVVLSEERLRDSPTYQAYVSQLGFQLQGQLAPRRMPIGKTDILQHAPVSRVRAFYAAQYRPDNAVVIAVGDFDVDRMEAKIKARFSDWRPSGPAPGLPDLGQVAARGADAAVFAHVGAPQLVSITWAEPYDPTPDTSARERRDLAELLALSVLNRRFEHLAQGANPPFVSAGAIRSNLVHSAKLTQILVQPKAGDWKGAIDAVVGEQRQLVQFGVRQDELDREIARLRTALSALSDGASTRTTPALADALVKSVEDDDVFSNPAQDLAEFEADVKGLDVTQVSATAKAVFSGAGPLVFVSDPAPIAGGAGAVKTALASAEAHPVRQASAVQTKVWPYASFGPPGRVAERHEISDLGVTEVRFSNGVRLLIKPTAFSKDQILVGVRAGYGRLDIPQSETRAVWTVSGIVPTLQLGGTQALTGEDIQQLTASKVVSVKQELADDAFVLSGTTRPQDLDLQLQLLAAYTVYPGFRPAALDRVKGALTAQLPRLDATAVGVFAREQNPILHGGDQRWQLLPTGQQVAATMPRDPPALLGQALASGPLEVTVVGDVTADQAINAVARTYGALPARPARSAPGPRALGVTIAPAAATPLVRTHAGRPDQAVAMEAWPTTDFYAAPQDQRTLKVLSDILQERVLEKIRIAQGNTYSPAADTQSSEVFHGVGYAEAHVEMPPAKIPTFYADLDAIVADLRAHPVTSDELERARRPTVEQRIKVQQTNAYWLTALDSVAGDNRQIDAIRKYVTGVQAVTAEDVQNAARKYLVADKAFRLVVRSPQSGMESPPVGSASATLAPASQSKHSD